MAMTTKEYGQRVEAWISQKWPPNTPCPMCHTVSGWELAAPLEIVIRPEIEGSPRGRVVPVVPLLCNNCSYLVMLGAIKMGVLAGTQEPDLPAPGVAADEPK